MGNPPAERPNGKRSAQLRLVSQVARLYHVRNLRQREIADLLRMSQARVSRLLAMAQEEGIVRTAVIVPEGLHPDPRGPSSWPTTSPRCTWSRSPAPKSIPV